MSRSRFALRLLVPNPLPGVADARTPAVVPRPGLAGATAVPSVALPAGVPVGVHPSWSPEMVPPAAVPLPVKLDSWPLTDQPGKVFLESATVTAFSTPVPVAGEPETARLTVPAATEKVKVPDAGTVTEIGTVPVLGAVVVTDIDVVPVEPLKAVVLVGVNTADNVSVAAAVKVVVVVATPLALTATGVPMLVPPASNCTVPAGWVPSVAVVVEVRATVVPTWAGFGDAVSVVFVAVACAGPVALVEYELPSADSVTKVDCTGVELPVPPGPVQQSTTHSSVWPGPTLVPRDKDWATFASRVPLNGAVGLATVGESTLPMLPSVLSTYRTADVWKPVGHAVLVDQVGVRLEDPLAGLRVRLPGWAPTPAWADAAVSSAAPAVAPATPSMSTVRRSRPVLGHFIVGPFM